MKYIANLLFIFSITLGAMSSTSQKKVFFIVGPAGSGKTTIADLVKNRNPDRVAHYSVGNLLRAEAQHDTQRGRMIKQIIEKANIVPLEIGMDVVSRAIQETSVQFVLLDGFPPIFEYAIAFEDLTKHDPTVKLVGAIEIFVDEHVAKERVLKRNRTDDAHAVFEMRYKRYVQNAEILNAWYKKFYIFNSIDGSQPLDTITESVEAQILSDI